MTPKEDPKDKAARERERRMSEIEQRQTAEKTAGGLTSDLFSVYGLKGLKGITSPMAKAPAVTPTTTQRDR